MYYLHFPKKLIIAKAIDCHVKDVHAIATSMGLPEAQWIPATFNKNIYIKILRRNEKLEFKNRCSLHGGLGQIEMFGPVIPILAKKRQVIGVDLHGHGRTGLGDRKINLIDIGNDLAAILTQLDYNNL